MTLRPVRALLLMEQHLGHQTYYENLRATLDGDRDLETTWAPIRYGYAPAIWERLPGLPAAILGALRGRHEVLRALSACDADVCFFNTQVPAVLGGRRARRRPYLLATDITPIQYDRMGAGYGHRPDRAGLLRWYKRRSSTATVRGAACLLPWSAWTASSLTSDYGVAPERIEVVAPGVDLGRWSPGPPREGRQPPRILFVGGDFWRKGGEVLLSAFRALPRDTADLVVATRTDIPDEPGIRVHRGLTPNSPGLIELYRGCDVFVLPSRAEAFGIAAVEAAATGLPIVAGEVGGLADIVVPGESGLLVPPGDAGALGQALGLLLRDPGRARRMGQAARRHAESRFDARRNGRRVAELLLRAAGRQR